MMLNNGALLQTSATKGLTDCNRFILLAVYPLSVLVQGNAKACEGQYVAAIEYFTKAIQLDSTDYR